MFLVTCHHSYNRGDSTSPKNSGLRAQPALVLFQPILFEFQNGKPRFTEWFDLTPRFGEKKRNDDIPRRFQRTLEKNFFGMEGR